MKLTSIFLSHVPTKRRSEGLLPPSEDALAALVDEGRKAHPALTLSDAAFVAFLAKALPTDAKPEDVRAADLFLACAYSLGEPKAVDTLENLYLVRARNLVRRMGLPAPMVDDILQEVREKLVAMNANDPDNAGYSGRGDLAGWLCIVAVHAANRRRERGEKELTLEDSEAVVLPTTEDDPEMAFLRREYREELLAAFREALASLSARERNLLRYTFLDGMSIDKIGALYGVHRVTASRWINQARDTLCSRTRELLSRRVTLSELGFQRVLGLIESQIQVNLEALCV